MPIRTIKGKNGRVRYQADVSDRSRGIERVKRTFSTKKEAQQWEAAVRANAQHVLLGGKRRCLFGETLTEYIEFLESLPDKENQVDGMLSLVKNLRQPAFCTKQKKWFRLELLPLEKTHDSEIDVVDGLRIWTDDQKKILRRSRLFNELYQLRLFNGIKTWFHQPAPDSEELPPTRYVVRDDNLLDALNKVKGYGPVAPDTLRIRQALVSRVLSWAFKERKTSSNQGAIVRREQPGGQREMETVHYAQFVDLLFHLPPHIDLAILAITFIGWRKANLLGLEWPRVLMPTYEGDVKATQGFAWVDQGYSRKSGERTKNRNRLIHPMSELTEQIFMVAQIFSDGPIVFHRGDGKPIGDIRKSYETAKRKAGIVGKLPPWHGWRHHFATWLGMTPGVNELQMMSLAGWTQRTMPANYLHSQDFAQVAGLSSVLDEMINRVKRS